MEEEKKLSFRVRGAIFEVHKLLGPGLLEHVYHSALYYELKQRNIEVKSKVSVPVVYKGVQIQDAYQLDLLVEDKIIIELKSVESLSKAHYKQLQNYLRLTGIPLGYLVNFNTHFMEDKRDIIRVVNVTTTDVDEI